MGNIKTSGFPKGAYIKYVGGWGSEGGRLQIFPKKFRSPGDHRPKYYISWPSNFFRKYFMAPSINFSFLFKAYLSQYFRVVLTVTFKLQMTKEINIHNNIQKIML